MGIGNSLHWVLLAERTTLSLKKTINSYNSTYHHLLTLFPFPATSLPGMEFTSAAPLLMPFYKHFSPKFVASTPLVLLSRSDQLKKVKTRGKHLRKQSTLELSEDATSRIGEGDNKISTKLLTSKKDVALEVCEEKECKTPTTNTPKKRNYIKKINEGFI